MITFSIIMLGLIVWTIWDDEKEKRIERLELNDDETDGMEWRTKELNEWRDREYNLHKDFCP